jgi:hypothetical protein
MPALITTVIGFILSCTLCFMLAVRGLRGPKASRTAACRRGDRLRHRLPDRRAGLLAVHQGAGHQPAGPHRHRLAVTGWLRHDGHLATFCWLLQGFATAGTPINLLWAFVGCAIGTAIGVLPGWGPAVTVAMLLPITRRWNPRPA